jgi:phosphoheptose isomerase
MRNSSKILMRAIVAVNQTLQSVFDLDAQVAKAADLMEESLRSRNKLLVRGNGGSAADAFHLQQSLWCASRKIAQPTRRSVFPAMAGYSLLRATIMVSMKFSLVRSRLWPGG